FEEVPSPTDEKGYHVIGIKVGNDNHIFEKDSTIYSKYMDGTTVRSVKDIITHNSEDTVITVVYKNETKLEHKQSLDASQTVRYVDENGNKLLPENNASDKFTYSGDTVDQVTGEVTEKGSWDKDSRTFDAVKVPVIDGYVAISGYQKTKDGKYVAGGFTATNTQGEKDRNQVFKVVYKKVGKIVPVDPNHKPIPGAETPNYQNKPEDPTKVTEDEPTPAVPGMHTDTPNVTPKDPTKDTEVVYDKNETKLEHKQSLDASQTVRYVDENGNKLLPENNASDKFTYSGDTVDQVTGEVTEKGSWDKDSRTFDAVKVVIDGYVAISGYQKTKDGKYVAGGFTATNTQGEKDRNQVFKVVYKKVGKIVPVDPNHKPIPGAETPNYQNKPEDPTKVTEVVYDKDVKDVTTVVHYIDEDDGNRVIFSSENLTGKEGTQIGYKSANDLKNLTDKGYVVDKNGYDPEGQIPKFDSKVP